ncbi:MAG: hypothetical protein M1834_002978 [Cirrosporium novae-zelandiae]|nr:MAG: hypothetical protein M1834_002978 [Cirrosporium novae-zelandiae]
MADLNIEETNRVRTALGLPPLPVPGAGPTFKQSHDSDSDTSDSDDDPASTLESRQAESYGNWKKLEDERKASARRAAQKEAIKKAKDSASRFQQLQGKTLGDEDDQDLSTAGWLKRHKKRQKQIEKEKEKAKKLEEELSAREKEEYSSKDLAGVKVAHELGEFDEGGEQILTLKDTTIEENEEEGDELENLDLREKEKLQEKLDLKKKKPVYNPNDIDETGEKSILAHYDEEIDGKKKKRFTLDGKGATAESREAMKRGVSEKLKSQSLSLDFLKDETPASDYMDFDPSEMKARKPKKKSKKAKHSRKKVVDDDDIFPTVEAPTSNGDKSNRDAMDIDSTSKNGSVTTAIKRKIDNTSFIDDDDLQASLAVTRRAALKKRKADLKQFAAQLREESPATPDPTEQNEEEPGLIIDETSEFIANLQKPIAPEPRRQRRSSSQTMPTAAGPEADAEPEPDAEGDIPMETIASPSASASRATSTPAPDVSGSTGLEEEAPVSGGLGNTLKMLRGRGVIKDNDSSLLNEIQRERQKFLADKTHREAQFEARARAQRERDRASGKLANMSARDREEYARWENRARDQAESRQIADIFNREYKPDVQLKYVDEFGRDMDAKEAFKHLSHQFHGKGSGKMKQEKRLKKIEDEKRREAVGVLDTSQRTGMNMVVGGEQKRKGQAGVRLA